ncbi:MAG: hypothetical protein Q4D38_09445 [Planctomycetia bacterium]|nr:hypothetical protein [Planctomycetia bacterium]
MLYSLESNVREGQELDGVVIYVYRALEFPFCEPWCVAPTADGTGNFNAKY